jgi:hypothetical protein
MIPGGLNRPGAVVARSVKREARGQGRSKAGCLAAVGAIIRRPLLPAPAARMLLEPGTGAMPVLCRRRPCSVAGARATPPRSACRHVDAVVGK